MKKRTIILTRPDGYNDTLMNCIEQLGHRAVTMPWLRAEVIWTDADRSGWWRKVLQGTTLVFVSATAVQAVVPQEIKWPEAVWAVATGEGTARALRSKGVPEARIRMPVQQFDSEGVWLECSDCFLPGTPVTIFRGQSGRAWLGDQATQVGCIVEYVTVYRRIPCLDKAEELTRYWLREGVDALVLTNSEAMSALAPLLPGELWKSIKIFVPHARIGETARRLGAENVIVTAGGDNGLCTGLREWLKE